MNQNVKKAPFSMSLTLKKGKGNALLNKDDVQ